MFGIGMQEIIVILVLALIVIGPKKLPEVAKALGKGYGEFRRAFEDMRSSINADISADTRAADESEKLRELSDRIPPPLQKPPDSSAGTPAKPEAASGDSEAGPRLPGHDPIEEAVEEEPVDRA